MAWLTGNFRSYSITPRATPNPILSVIKHICAGFCEVGWAEALGNLKNEGPGETDGWGGHAHASFMAEPASVTVQHGYNEPNWLFLLFLFGFCFHISEDRCGVTYVVPEPV